MAWWEVEGEVKTGTGGLWRVSSRKQTKSFGTRCGPRWQDPARGRVQVCGP